MSQDEDVASYWDWILETFGVSYYLHVRYYQEEDDGSA